MGAVRQPISPEACGSEHNLSRPTPLRFNSFTSHGGLTSTLFASGLYRPATWHTPRAVRERVCISQSKRSTRLRSVALLVPAVVRARRVDIWKETAFRVLCARVADRLSFTISFLGTGGGQKGHDREHGARQLPSQHSRLSGHVLSFSSILAAASDCPKVALSLFADIDSRRSLSRNLIDLTRQPQCANQSQNEPDTFSTGRHR